MGDSLLRQQFVPNPLAGTLESQLINPPADRDIDDLLAHDHLCNLRLLRFIRKRLDGIDPLLHFIDQLAHIRMRQKLNGHHPDAFGSIGDRLLNALKTLDGILNFYADCLFNLLGRRARVNHLNHHPVGTELRENLLLDLGDRQQAGHNNECRQ